MSRLIAPAAAAALMIFALTGCSDTSTAATQNSTSPSAQSGEWPRQIQHDAGTTELEAEPLRIVSTSPSITGSLLAIDAPLIGTGATMVTSMTDDKGFFTQWAEEADDANVQVAYQNLELDLDAVDALEPDLIIGSVNGGDSVLDSYDQLSEIAPTILLDYGTETWQQLTTTLAEATGRESEASAVLQDYDNFVAEQAENISLPAQPVTALAYLGADGVWAYDESSPQAALLESLGFDYLAVPGELSQQQAATNGVDILSSENVPAALADTHTAFLVGTGTAAPIDAFSSDALLANLPSVENHRVYDLGSTSFRLDYYSAKDTVSGLVETFGK
ncbi:Fe2+-enterobactin ABC transporter substrate-binding protein [Glutamicibacter sp. NPDC087344]|uniref:Fe2+-enterobactin ABC transporter substrate-binding protein n=1 Tax=Glutamicibacter sp. NPDC087344 TaxID=3363994 RepID=UPI0038102A50